MKKICSKCKEEKEVSLFSKHRSKPDGLQPSCKLCSHATRLQWGRDNSDRIREHHVKYNYGVTKARYNAMLLEQDNSCKICSKPFGTSTPHVDHDHTCCSGGKGCGNCVRGLLCRRCNLFLGFFENFKFMDQVKRYLEQYTNSV